MFLPLEYLLINIIWIYELFQQERGCKYEEALLAEPQEEAILAGENGPALVLGLGFLLFPFVKKYEKLLSLSSTPEPSEADGYFKVMSVFFQRLLKKSD